MSRLLIFEVYFKTSAILKHVSAHNVVILTPNTIYYIPSNLLPKQWTISLINQIRMSYYKDCDEIWIELLLPRRNECSLSLSVLIHLEIANFAYDKQLQMQSIQMSEVDGKQHLLYNRKAEWNSYSDIVVWKRSSENKNSLTLVKWNFVQLKRFLPQKAIL